jgi:hypothetical protein
MALLLSHLTLLPLFLAGLGIGLYGVAAAAATGMLILAVFVGPPAALVYGMVNGLPALVLSRQALLARTQPDGSVEWYPGGLLLCWLVGIVGVTYVVVLLYFELLGEGLVAAVREVLRSYTEAMGDVIQPEGAESILAAAPLVPGLAASYYMLNAILNAALAQYLLRRSGRNLRPSVVFADLTLPPQLLWLLPASLLAAFVSDALAPVAYTLAFIVMVAYFLLGLAVVHAFLRRRANAGAALFGFYVVFSLLMVLFSAIGIAMVGLGVAEQVVGIRRRFLGSGQGSGKEDD